MTTKTVLVFRTSVTHPQQVEATPAVAQWVGYSGGTLELNLEDCDNILRVETQQLRADSIAMALRVRASAAKNYDRA